MASNTTRKLCSLCNDELAHVICGGCGKCLCLKDYEIHKQDLENELKTIWEQNRIFSNKLDEGIDQTHDIIVKVNKWKENSIRKIEEAADDAIRVLKDALVHTSEDLKGSSHDLDTHISLSIEKKNYTDFEVNSFKQTLENYKKEFEKPSHVELIYDDNNQSSSIVLIQVKHQRLNRPPPSRFLNQRTIWNPNGETILGPNSSTSSNEQITLDSTFSIDIDQIDGTIYVADQKKHQIVAFNKTTNCCEIVAGGRGEGNQLNQLAHPVAIAVDYRKKSLIVADWKNRRILRCPREKNAQVEIIATEIDCNGVAIDKHGNIYVSDYRRHRVQQYTTSGNIRTVAGGNEAGNAMNQLNSPSSLFVDEEGSLYISDSKNHRVVKWLKDASNGIVVAGGNGHGKEMRQLHDPRGLFVDSTACVYVADQRNNRIMRWCKDAEEGTVISDGKKQTTTENQTCVPCDLSFDQKGNLYIADVLNPRIQVFGVLAENDES